MIRILASGAALLGLAAVARAEETLYVQTATALRQSPAQVAPVLLQLEAGRSVHSFGRRGDWVNVRTLGSPDAPAATGWLPYTAVAPSPPDGETPPPDSERR